jgi:signal transduction histidine kinase/CheY-like chemotaxis protein
MAVLVFFLSLGVERTQQEQRVLARSEVARTRIADNVTNAKLVNDAMNHTYKAKARAVADIVKAGGGVLSENNAVLTSNEMARIAVNLGVSEIYVLKPNGEVRVCSKGEHRDINFFDDRVFMKFEEIVGNAGLEIITDPYDMQNNGTELVYTAVSAGDGLAVVGTYDKDAEILLANCDMYAVLRRMNLETSDGAYAVFCANALDGKIIYHKDGGVIGQTIENWDSLRPDDDGASYIKIGGEDVICAGVTVGSVVVGAYTTTDSSVSMWLAAVFAGIFLLIMILMMVIFRRFMYVNFDVPLRTISSAMNTIAQDNAHVNIDLPAFTEYDAVKRSIEKMSDSLIEKVINSESMVRELENSRKRAESANDAKTSFLANMSHEIRTPLNAVIGFTELALDDVLTQKTEDFLHKILTSANGLLDIVNNILDITKIEAGKMTLEKIPFSISDILKTCKTMNTPKAKEKGLTLTVFTAPGAAVNVQGDPIKLRQCVLNLISNAIKFTRTGLVKVAVSLAEEQPRDKDKIALTFEVADSGIGMTPAQISDIFKPFIQGDLSTTRKYGGTGLGLPITKNIVELMGGSLLAESSPGIGSRFYFTLTFERVADPGDGSAPAAVQENIAETNRPRFTGDVLVFEDSILNQQVINEHLLRIGFKTVIAENGKIGVGIVAERLKNPFDLILMDIHMPVMDGVEATKHIKALGVKTPVIAMTANVMAKDRETYLAAGMSAYIGKPFVARELWTVIAKFIKPIDYTGINHAAAEPQMTPVAALMGVIDYAAGLERSAGDEKLYEHVKDDFFSGANTLFDGARESLVNGDIKAAHRMAHTLKGQAGLIGAEKLRTASFGLEQLLKQILDGKSGGDIDSMFSRVKGELDSVLQQLKDDREGKPRQDRDAKRMSVDKAIGVMIKLEPLIRSSDAEALDYIDDLRLLPEKVTPLADNLIMYLDDYEFDAALAAAIELKSRLEELNG